MNNLYNNDKREIRMIVLPRLKNTPFCCQKFEFRSFFNEL